MRAGALAAVLAGLLLLSGCGSSTSHKKAPPHPAAQTEHFATLGVETPARMSNGVLAARYTCKGANISPPIAWAGVSTKAKEIVILVRELVGRGDFAVNWAVAGINPTVRTLAPGALPPGAVVGRNSFGRDRYNLCPVSNVLPLVTIAVLALPQTLNLQPGFDPTPLTQEAVQPGVQWGSVVAYSQSPSGGGPSGG